MAKKAKVELTLEELQAKKAKRQRGWVRFCAILLAVVLTLGIYGMASSGGPTVIPVYPNLVQAQTRTVVQTQQSEPAAQAPSDVEEDTTSAPAPTTDDSGSLLDTLMGLLGGIDLSSLAGKLNLDGLGITVAGGIQNAKDSLLTLIDQLEASITGKPVIVHDAVEYDFDEGIDPGDAAVRQDLVDKLNAATQEGVGYTVTRFSAYPMGGNVNIGEHTETINKVLSVVGITLDDVVGEFAGVVATETGEPLPITYTVPQGVSAETAVAMAELDASYVNYSLMPTQLTADDIAIVDMDAASGFYMFLLKDVDNPNRRADCGLTRFTNDYLVQNELADRVKNSISITEVSNGPLKLTDFDTQYSNIQVMVQFDPATGHLLQMDYYYETYSRFTVRTNSVQVVGSASLMTANTYSDFVY